MSHRVLVVEDSPTQAAALAADLEKGGYRTEHAITGDAALEVLETEAFDVVISDIVMPGEVDGYGVCRWIKQRRPETPVVLLTGLSDPMDIIHGLDCGANNFITKPYDITDLLQRLDVLLRMRDQRRHGRLGMGVKILFMGREFEITAEREQILDMLVTTFEEAVKQNRKLREREEELERARSELAAYAESLEARLERLADSVPEVLYSVAIRDGVVKYASRASASVFGIPPEDFSLERWSEGLHPEDRGRALAELREAVVTTKRRSLEYRYTPPRSTDVRWIEQTVIPVSEPGGEVERVEGIARDVTDARTAEERIRQHEERYRSLAFATAQIVWTTDADGQVVEPLPTWQDFTGRAFDDVRGTGWLGAVHPDDRARTHSMWRQAVEQRRHYDIEYRLRRHDGEYRWFVVRGLPVVNLDGSTREWVGTCADVTEQRRAEEELRSSEERFHTVFASSPLGIGITSLDGRIIDINPAFTAILGYPLDVAVGRTALELGIYVDERERDELYRRLDRSDGPPPPMRVRNRARDGRVLTLLVSVNRMELGTQPCYVTFFQDVTALTEAEDAVRRHTERLRLLQTVTASVADVESLADALDLAVHVVGEGAEWDAGHAYVRDQEGVMRPSRGWFWGPAGEVSALREASDAYATDSGLGLVGRVAESRAPEWLEDLSAGGRFARAQGRRALGMKSVVAVPIVVAGRSVAVLEFFSRESRAEDRQLVDVLLQIGTQLGRVAERETARSERDRIEAQARQAQKMEAVGRLAGGVAHDFNNLLTVIMTEAQLLRMARGDDMDAELDESLREIEDAGRRAAGLTNQLLTFSRREIREPEVFDPREVVNSLEKMLKRLIGEDVRLDVVASDLAGRVRADRGQFEQVVVNLVVNARDAMPDGGTVVIEARDVTLDAGYVEGHPGVAPGRYVMIAVSDNGVGMTREVQSKLFEPFFTTKALGKGTGLGLATSYGIVRESGGHIAVYSELSIGTTMKVYLPAVEDDPDRRDATQGEAALPRGDERLLVVEDEAKVRQVALRTLEALGYEVLAPAGAREALEMLAGETPFDLLFTDVVMPTMSGSELAEKAQELRPALPVLFTTGYTDDVAFRSELLQNGLDVLPKPYTSADLARKVREVLDRSRGFDGDRTR